MDFDICVKMKENGFPQNSEWELRQPNISVMMSYVKLEEAYWKNGECIVVGGGTKAAARDFVNALGTLWLNQNT